MSKRQRSDRRDGAKRRRHGQKHLYLVLDDWEKGYSIHEIDDHAFENRRSSYGAELKLAPVVRLEAPRGVLIGALGSKVVALWQPTVSKWAVAYDTKTAGLAVGPPHPDALQTMRFVVAAGKKLYAVHEGGVHCLDLEAEEHQWAWTRASSSPLRLPGCDQDGPVEITSTFSLDTGGDGDAGWKRRGEWLLPFLGQGHYDADLDAWVGLHSRRYMCTCDVPEPLADVRSGDDDHDAPAPPQPTWELVSASSLFSADPDPRRGDSAASLVHMGNGEFCVVEALLATGEYVQLRLIRFRFERDRHGRLRASSRHCGALSCIVRKLDPLFSPRAFCM
ncbi:hypothetical protein ACQ4PT_010503 [Festuca glaucescens]